MALRLITLSCFVLYRTGVHTQTLGNTQNLLTNGGCEAGRSGWGGFVEVFYKDYFLDGFIPFTPKEGKAYCAFSVNTNSEASYTIWQSVPLNEYVPGTTFFFSVFVASSLTAKVPRDEVQFVLNWQNSSRQTVQQDFTTRWSSSNPVSTDWTLLSVVAVMPATATTMNLTVVGYRTSALRYIDILFEAAHFAPNLVLNPGGNFGEYTSPISSGANPTIPDMVLGDSDGWTSSGAKWRSITSGTSGGGIIYQMLPVNGTRFIASTTAFTASPTSVTQNVNISRWDVGQPFDFGVTLGTAPMGILSATDRARYTVTWLNSNLQPVPGADVGTAIEQRSRLDNSDGWYPRTYTTRKPNGAVFFQIQLTGIETSDTTTTDAYFDNVYFLPSDNSLSQSTLSISFPTVYLSAQQTSSFTLSNNAAISSMDINVTSCNAAVFSVNNSNTVRLSISPKRSSGLVIRSTGAVAGNFSCALSISTNEYPVRQRSILLEAIVTDQRVDVNTTAVDIGQRHVNSSWVIVSVLVMNRASYSNLSIRNVTTTFPPNMVVSTALPSSIPANSSSPISILYRLNLTQTVGINQGVVSISTDDPAALVVNLTFSVLASDHGLITDAFNFGTVHYSRVRISRTFSLVNKGAAGVLMIDSVAVTPISEFFSLDTVITYPIVLTPGQSYNISFTFTAYSSGRASGPGTASLVIQTNSVPEQQTITLLGAGVDTTIEVITPSPLRLPQQHRSMTLLTTPITIMNNNTVGSLIISAASFNTSGFRVTTTLPLTVAAGATANLLVAMNVTTPVGDKAAVLTLTTNDVVNPTVSMTLIGLLGDYTVTAVTAQLIEFPTTHINQPVDRSVPRQVTVMNPGGRGTVTIRDISLTDTTNFILSGNVSTGNTSSYIRLGPGESFTISVTFAPRSVNVIALMANVTILNDGPTPVITFNLRGNATNANITFTPNIVTLFQNQPANDTLFNFTQIDTATVSVIGTTGVEGVIMTGVSFNVSEDYSIANISNCRTITQGCSLVTLPNFVDVGRMLVIRVIFNPLLQNVGTRFASLLVSTNHWLTTTVTVLARGRSFHPEVSVQVDPVINFGDWDIYESDAFVPAFQQSNYIFSVINVGFSGMSVSNVSIVQSIASQSGFKLNSTISPTAPIGLAAGQSRGFAISWNPESPGGTYTATLWVFTNDTLRPQLRFPIVGQAVRPLKNATLSFRPPYSGNPTTTTLTVRVVQFGLPQDGKLRIILPAGFRQRDSVWATVNGLVLADQNRVYVVNASQVVIDTSTTTFTGVRFGGKLSVVIFGLILPKIENCNTKAQSWKWSLITYDSQWRRLEYFNQISLPIGFCIDSKSFVISPVPNPPASFNGVTTSSLDGDIVPILLQGSSLYFNVSANSLSVLLKYNVPLLDTIPNHDEVKIIGAQYVCQDEAPEFYRSKDLYPTDATNQTSIVFAVTLFAGDYRLCYSQFGLTIGWEQVGQPFRVFYSPPPVQDPVAIPVPQSMKTPQWLTFSPSTVMTENTSFSLQGFRLMSNSQLYFKLSAGSVDCFGTAPGVNETGHPNMGNVVQIPVSAAGLYRLCHRIGFEWTPFPTVVEVKAFDPSNSLALPFRGHLTCANAVVSGCGCFYGNGTSWRLFRMDFSLSRIVISHMSSVTSNVGCCADPSTIRVVRTVNVKDNAPWGFCSRA